MEAHDPTLTRRIKNVDIRSKAELRLRDAVIMLRLYMRNSPHLVDINRRTTLWMDRHIAQKN